MFAKYCTRFGSKSIPIIGHSQLAATSVMSNRILTLTQCQKSAFTIYSGYGKTTPDLEAIHDEWVQTYNKRDADHLCELYTDDCTIMPCGEAQVTGRENAKKFFTEHLNEISEVVAHLDEAGAMDNNAEMAFIRGTYTYLNIGDADNVVDDGKNVLVLKKVGGQWKIYIDIWASNHKHH